MLAGSLVSDVDADADADANANTFIAHMACSLHKASYDLGKTWARSRGGSVDGQSWDPLRCSPLLKNTASDNHCWYTPSLHRGLVTHEGSSDTDVRLSQKKTESFRPSGAVPVTLQHAGSFDPSMAAELVLGKRHSTPSRHGLEGRQKPRSLKRKPCGMPRSCQCQKPLKPRTAN